MIHLEVSTRLANVRSYLAEETRIMKELEQEMSVYKREHPMCAHAEFMAWAEDKKLQKRGHAFDLEQFVRVFDKDDNRLPLTLEEVFGAQPTTQPTPQTAQQAPQTTTPSSAQTVCNITNLISPPSSPTTSTHSEGSNSNQPINLVHSPSPSANSSAVPSPVTSPTLYKIDTDDESDETWLHRGVFENDDFEEEENNLRHCPSTTAILASLKDIREQRAPQQHNAYGYVPITLPPILSFPGLNNLTTPTTAAIDRVSISSLLC